MTFVRPHLRCLEYFLELRVPVVYTLAVLAPQKGMAAEVHQEREQAVCDEVHRQLAGGENLQHGIYPNPLNVSQPQNPGLVDGEPTQHSQESSSLRRHLVSAQQSFKHRRHEDQGVLERNCKSLANHRNTKSTDEIRVSFGIRWRNDIRYWVE